MRAHESVEADEEVELDEVMSELEAGQSSEAEEEADEAEALPHEVVRYQEALAAMGAILEGGEVDLDELGALGAHEREALTSLVTIVRGAEGTRQILAEDRLAQLERVLAVMQPVLSIGVLPGAEAQRDSFFELVERIDELRHELEQLEAAQEEPEVEEEEAEAATDAGDEDEPAATAPPAPGASEEDAPAAAKAASRKLDATLAAQRKARKAAAARAARAAARPATPVPEVGSPERVSTLAGAPGEPAVERPPWKSTLTGEDEPR